MFQKSELPIKHKGEIKGYTLYDVFFSYMCIYLINQFPDQFSYEIRERLCLHRGREAYAAEILMRWTYI